LTPSGNRGKWETPQAEPRRLPTLPEESKFPQRRPTGYNHKQKSIRKQLLKKKINYHLTHSLFQEKNLDLLSLDFLGCG
jgi:hypothetical protein